MIEQNIEQKKIGANRKRIKGRLRIEKGCIPLGWNNGP